MTFYIFKTSNDVLPADDRIVLVPKADYPLGIINLSSLEELVELSDRTRPIIVSSGNPYPWLEIYDDHHS